MTQANRLDDAYARLAKALETLESVVAQRLEDELTTADLEEELAVMQDDRSRLAFELDAALARAGALEKTKGEVLRRIDRASASVSAALGGLQGARGAGEPPQGGE
jgi:D-serine deaminase-like pyridoxal phosphate-dependent protein